MTAVDFDSLIRTSAAGPAAAVLQVIGMRGPSERGILHAHGSAVKVQGE